MSFIQIPTSRAVAIYNEKTRILFNQMFDVDFNFVNNKKKKN